MATTRCAAVEVAMEAVQVASGAGHSTYELRCETRLLTGLPPNVCYADLLQRFWAQSPPDYEWETAGVIDASGQPLPQLIPGQELPQDLWIKVIMDPSCRLFSQGRVMSSADCRICMLASH